jgi:redox-sensitive bicupin YhaK (pirin superfamily)
MEKSSNKERKIRLRSRGNIQEMGPAMVIRAALPNQDIEYISPFILLHHIQPAVVEAGWDHIGVPEHPHKGFITFTYMLDGSFRHRDSSGGQGLIGSGGAQWMMTGSGILHEEMIAPEFALKGGRLELLQLWINVPAVHKNDPPNYRILAASQMPRTAFGKGSSYLQVLAGTYQDAVSPVDTLSPLSILRVHLDPGATGTVEGLEDSFNLMGYITSGEIGFGAERTIINDGETILFANSGNSLVLENTGPETADLFLFAGKPITEPMVASGPFVMNTQEEIQQAYREYRQGKFGRFPVND